MDTYSLYVHIPFCVHRCSYCDFNTFAGKLPLLPEYIFQLCHELKQIGTTSAGQIQVHTVYLGGGTPSLLRSVDHQKILDTIHKYFQVLDQAEISLEANPGTVTQAYLQDLVKSGYNRISFGMQTADPGLLTLLERQHNVEDVIEAVKWARQAGFHSINLDLIIGLPGQTLAQWQRTLEFAVDLNVEHLSLYALTVEEGTSLSRWIDRGLVPAPDDDLIADMYEWASDYLSHVGFSQYEISNWARAKPDGETYACRHNLQYWRNQPYLGIGAGAHGFCASIPSRGENEVLQGARIENVGSIEAYLQQMANGAPKTFPFSAANRQVTYLSKLDEMQETLMVGLRLTQEGVSARAFEMRFNCTLEEIFGRQIQKLVAHGLLERYGPSGDGLRLTQRGRLLGNQVFMEFVGN